jgi:hypothetical protein
VGGWLDDGARLRARKAWDGLPRGSAVRTRPMTHPLTLARHLRSCRSEQRFRYPPPEDAGRADAGAAEPRQAPEQREREIQRPVEG